MCNVCNPIHLAPLVILADQIQLGFCSVFWMERVWLILVVICVMCVIQFSSRRSPSGSAIRFHVRAHSVPRVRPRCVCSVLLAHVQFCRFDKAYATADVQ